MLNTTSLNGVLDERLYQREKKDTETGDSPHSLNYTASTLCKHDDNALIPVSL